MSQATDHHSITSRRRFLAVAAASSAVSAGSLAVAAMPAAPVPTIPATAEPLQRVRDPILDAIEAHKAAYANLASILDAHTLLEKELPREKRQSNVDAWEELIIFDDDPRWIDCERAAWRAFEAEEDAAIALVCTTPTTKAGFLAILEYALAHDLDGKAWPDDIDDGQRRRAWHCFLIESLVAARSVLGEPGEQLRDQFA